MPQNRFAISALSKSRYETAYIEEILVDKNTGEFLVKTANNDIVSYNYTMRLKNHVNDILNICNELGIYGSIQAISIPDMMYPVSFLTASIQTYTFNTDLGISGTDINNTNLVIHCDLDCLSKDSNGFLIVPRSDYDITATLTIRNATTSVEASVPLYDMNNNIGYHTVSLNGYISDPTSVELKDISVNATGIENGKCILHSIFIASDVNISEGALPSNLMMMESNRNEQESPLNLLRQFVFGGNSLKSYDDTKTYIKGERIIHTNDAGDVLILIASEDNITGSFDISKWSPSSLTDDTSSNNDSLIVLNDTQPEADSNTSIYFKPVSVHTYDNLPS